LAFEDATGAKDTLWLVWHPDCHSFSHSIIDNPELGEVSIPITEIDTGSFVVWFLGNSPNTGSRVYAPRYCWAGTGIEAANYVLPITIRWDTTQFQSPALLAPECVGIGANQWGAGVTVAGLGNNYFDFSTPSELFLLPHWPWLGFILFLDQIVLPVWDFGDHFPLSFFMLCYDPDDSPWSTRNLRSAPELIVSPNPATDELQVQTTQPWHHAVVHSVEGKPVLQSSYSQNSGRVHIGSLAPGVYLLVLFDANGSAVGRARFVKQ
jgi:hypothetical protein